MSIEIANSIHAQATVRYTGSPNYIGQSNFGFAAFGTNPTDSQRIAVGQYRMRMLAPINMMGTRFDNADAKGEGQILVRAIPNNLEVAFPIVPPYPRVTAVPASGGTFQDILVQLQSSGVNGYQGASSNFQLSNAASNASNVYGNLVSTTLVLPVGTPGIVTVQWTATVDGANGAVANFQILIDGTLAGQPAANGASCSFVTGALKQSVGMVRQFSGLAAGSHTIAVQWKVSTGTVTCDPTTATEHAGVFASEPSTVPAAVDADVPFEIIVLREPQQSTN